MKVDLIWMNGRKDKVDVSEKFTIKQLKKKIFDLYGYDIELQVMSIQGSAPANDALVKEETNCGQLPITITISLVGGF